MIALNKKEITRKSITFWVLFSTLLLSTLFVVYFFVWAAHKESEDYLAKIQENKSILNKQFVLQPKMDSLYNLMEHLEYGSVDNVRFLSAYIKDQKRGIQQLIAADTAATFSGYSKVVQRLDEQMQLRDTIIELVRTGEDIRESLLQYNSRDGRIGRSLIRGSRQQ